MRDFGLQQNNNYGGTPTNIGRDQNIVIGIPDDVRDELSKVRSQIDDMIRDLRGEAFNSLIAEPVAQDLEQARDAADKADAKSTKSLLDKAADFTVCNASIMKPLSSFTGLVQSSNPVGFIDHSNSRPIRKIA